MKKPGIFALSFLMSLGICSMVNAQVAPYFGPSNTGSSTSGRTTDQIDSNLNPYGTNANLNLTNPYLYDNYNYTITNIFLKSICDPAIGNSLRGMSKSPNNNDSMFYLANGQIWKQYIIFGGQIIENTSTSHTYIPYNQSQPKVKIYRDKGTYGCKIMIDGDDTGAYVYRVN